MIIRRPTSGVGGKRSLCIHDNIHLPDRRKDYSSRRYVTSGSVYEYDNPGSRLGVETNWDGEKPLYSQSELEYGLPTTRSDLATSHVYLSKNIEPARHLVFCGFVGSGHDFGRVARKRI